MKNRFWSIVLAICLLLSCVPITVFAANDDATDLQNLLNSGGTVTLTKDYTIDTTLNVTNTVTLDLNGYTISMTGSGSVMAVGGSGNLTVKDSRPTATHTDASLPAGGVITGGNANRGGGVSVAYGSFTLEGGTIASCSATTRGGGVHIFAGGSMTMTGGAITNCSATDGGGVFNENTFTMNGGSIANCSSTVPYASGGGGGVYNIGNFTMSDGVIENCSAASSFGGGVFNENAFTMRGGTIRGCSAKYGGGVRVDFSTFTISGGTIEACTETVNGKSDAVTMSFDASLLGNGGTIKGMVTAGSNSTIKNTSADGCTVFYDAVTNYGTISGGVYYGGIQNKSSGTVSGTYHTVSFDLNGGSGTAPIPQWFFNTNTAKALQPDDPINDAYNTFAGWYNGDTKYDFNQPVTQDITLTAKFINPKAYNISYDLDGGTATNPETYYVESDAITLNNPVKTGYTFTGWSGTGLTGENNMTVTIAKGSTGNRAYTAHFSQNSYTVKFDTVGGSSISDKTGVAWTDTVLSGITAPTKDSFEFTGWKCEDKTVNANAKYSDLAANDTVTSITLVAQWKDIENPVITGLENGKTYCATVEFEVSDNDKIESVKAGDEVLTVGADGKYCLSAGVGTVTVAVTDSS
ncbi:MAG: InlB B-repeat-containing protein, partial [Clostridia bacterium]|nr:InlB B-repeat-containing protein [Clostridia bacterium]